MFFARSSPTGTASPRTPKPWHVPPLLCGPEEAEPPRPLASGNRRQAVPSRPRVFDGRGCVRMPKTTPFADSGRATQPLGIAIVGGLIFSQLLTLYTTPVVYLYLNRFSLWWGRHRGT